MRQVHRAGAKLFDYIDQKPRVIDPTTGEVIEGELSVAVLGAPNYTRRRGARYRWRPALTSAGVNSRRRVAFGHGAVNRLRRRRARGRGARTSVSPRARRPIAGRR